MPTMFEVEAKYRVDSLADFERRLSACGAVRGDTRQEHDTYFAHPTRNFAETGEAFRLRSINGSHCLTYKGPREEHQFKVRKEIELPIGTPDHPRDEVVAMLAALSFVQVADVAKVRTLFTLASNESDAAITVTLDDVRGLPPFVEVEVCSSDEQAAVRDVERASELLRLSEEHIEKLSYLELVLGTPEPRQAKL